jgi:membrane protease YdiL (CAAX protease family)
MIVFGVFSVIGVGVREECLCRGVIQNIIAKKYANSVKGIWITVIVSAIIFGLLHVPNILVGMKPLALLSQVLTATFTAIFFGAVYLRSGSIWALILIHTLTDLASLAKSMFYEGVSDVDIANELSLKWDSIVVYLIFLGVSAFLLRPSKCKQIYESLCFADETAKTETDAEPEI